jgi:hypothetical protein
MKMNDIRISVLEVWPPQSGEQAFTTQMAITTMALPTRTVTLFMITPDRVTPTAPATKSVSTRSLQLKPASRTSYLTSHAEQAAGDQQAPNGGRHNHGVGKGRRDRAERRQRRNQQ